MGREKKRHTVENSDLDYSCMIPNKSEARLLLFNDRFQKVFFFFSFFLKPTLFISSRSDLKYLLPDST